MVWSFRENIGRIRWVICALGVLLSVKLCFAITPENFGSSMSCRADFAGKPNSSAIEALHRDWMQIDPRPNPTSIADFCRETAEAYQEGNIIEEKPTTSQAFLDFQKKLSETNVESRPTQAQLGLGHSLSAWRLSLYPSKPVRWAAFEASGLNILFFSPSKFGSRKGEWKLVRDPLPPYRESLDQLIERIQNFEVKDFKVFNKGFKPEKIPDMQQDKGSQYDETIISAHGSRPVGYGEYLGVCGAFTLLGAKECADTLLELIDFVSPNVHQIPFPQYLSRIIGDARNAEGARKATVRILNRLKSPVSDPKANFFDDFVAGFQDAGETPSEANRRAWEMMAVYASGGANINPIMLLANANGALTTSALIHAFAAVSYLDADKASHGLPLYSYPPGVKTRCDFGKSYHFWMNAVLTRYFIQKGRSAEAATLAAYVSDVGYQMQSRTTGRDPSRAFRVDSFDPANNKIRIDLAFSAAGAEFGAQATADSGNPIVIEVDQKLQRLLKDGSAHAGNEEEGARASETSKLSQLRTLSLWLDIFSPKSALR